MRNFLLLALIFGVQLVCFADFYDKNAVFLDVKSLEEETNMKKGSVNMEKMNVEYKENPNKKEQDTLLYEDVNRMRPKKKSVSKSIEKEVLKDTSVGATYSTTEKSGNLDDSVSLYSKYKKDKFAVTASYNQSRNGMKENGATSGSVSIAPELDINKHIKLKNVYTDNMASKQQKNEVVLSVSPFKDDRMDFDIGAGEIFSNGNQPAQSQINLGTKFRF